MIVDVRPSAVKGIKPHEWLLRFMFGGMICVAAGQIAKAYGPVAGGFFLAFPAIFPASASLIASHEKQHKARAGFDGVNRGKLAAAIDATGTGIGCVGLAAFAVACWLWLPRFSTVLVFLLATLIWLSVSVGIWFLRKRRIFNSRHVISVSQRQ